VRHGSRTAAERLDLEVSGDADTLLSFVLLPLGAWKGASSHTPHQGSRTAFGQPHLRRAVTLKVALRNGVNQAFSPAFSPAVSAGKVPVVPGRDDSLESPPRGSHDPPVHHLAQQSGYDERLRRVVGRANVA
jgi:hypothetical protein